MRNRNYVHGYSQRESERLSDQADTLADLLHHDTVFPPGSLVLEAGCGTGAQTVHIAPLNPQTQFISIDISSESIETARARLTTARITNVDLRTGDIFRLDFPEDHFDHIMVCFVLEHLSHPVQALQALKHVLKPQGTITVIEGDHGSAYFHPDSLPARQAVQTQVTLQAAAGGNANIGRCLYPLLAEAGFDNCKVSPRLVYADSSRPEMVSGFTLNTFTAMIEGVRDQAIANNLMTMNDFDKGIEDLKKTAGPDGVFCYTFFKGTGTKSSE